MMADRSWARSAQARVAIVLALGGPTACIEEQRYHVLEKTVELTPDTPPAYVTKDDDPVFRVERAFALRITPPTDRELAQLSNGDPARRHPFARLPWVALSDLDLQLDFSLTNHSTERLTATVTINGVNEFFYYAPGPENFHQWERRIALEPGARVFGSVSELELDEVAIDLATAVNGAPNSNLVVDPRSQSGRDPRVQPFIPQTIPGLVGIRAGIQSGRAVNMTLELSIRAQDHGHRAARRGERAWELPEPQPFTPIVPDIE